MRSLFFKLYIFILSVWMGSLVYQAILQEAWYADPVGYIDHVTSFPVPGATDPFPQITVIYAIVTVLGIFVLLGYHGAGKRTAFISYIGSFMLLFATYFYFIPTWDKLFETGVFNNQVVSMSREWIILNYLRLLLAIIAFFTALIALSKFKLPVKAHGKRTSL